MKTRTKAGLIAIALAILSVVGFFRHYSQMVEGAYVRTAVVMGVLWFAWPEIARLPRWLFVAVPVFLGVAAFQPRILLVLVPIFMLYGFLLPKPKKQTSPIRSGQREQARPSGAKGGSNPLKRSC